MERLVFMTFTTTIHQRLPFETCSRNKNHKAFINNIIGYCFMCRCRVLVQFTLPVCDT